MKISTPKITVVLALLAISTIMILQGILHHGGEKRYPRRHSGGDGAPLSPLLRGNQTGEPGRWRRKGHEVDSAMDGNTSGSALANVTSTGLLAQEVVSGQASGASTAASAAREKYAGVWARNMRLMKQRHERNGSASCPRGSDQHVTVVDLDHPRGGTFNETIPKKYLVLPIPPHEIMAEYGQAARIPAYRRALNGGWAQNASSGWGKELMLDAWPTPTDIRSKNDIIDINLDFLLRAKQGELEKAFEVLSNAGQKDAGGHRMRDEPWPGMLVLRKAAFGQKTETVSTCDVYYVGGCWKKFGGRSSQVLKSYSPACVAGGDAKNYRMFQHVLHLVTQKSFPHFYHFLTEFLSRVALLADFLKENPHVLVHGWLGNEPFFAWGLGQGNIKSILGISSDRIVRGDGCAEVLYIPETTRCQGLEAGMGHVTRAFINRFLSLSMDPPPKRQASPRYVVLVKRAEGGPRSMTNFGEVESAVVRELSPWGVEAVTHQGGTLLDQLALFGGAMGVLGPHGAGLSLILAMDEGRAVVEYLPQKWNEANKQNLASNLVPNICYLRLSAMLGLEYRVVPVIDGQFTMPMTVDAALGATALAHALRSRGHIGTGTTE